MTYDYDKAREYAAQVGMIFQDDWLPQVDDHLSALGLDQEDVDTLMRQYIWHVKWLFTPKNYGVLARIRLALFFLIGR